MSQGKKRWPWIALVAVAVIGIGSIVVETVGTAIFTEAYSEDTLARLEKAEDNRSWTRTSEQTVTLTCGTTSMTLDTATGHFSVTDDRTDQTYASALTEEQAATAAVAEKIVAQSEVLLSYFDSNDALIIMTTQGDSVSYGAPTVYVADTAVRVCYRLGTVKEEYLLPIALEKATFETLLEKAGSGSRKLRLYYDLFSPDNPTDSYKEKLKQYPCLASHDVYLLRQDSVTETMAAELSGYLTQAGYTEEAYQAELERLGISEESAETESSFEVTVEYTLTEQGFTARIPLDGLSSGLKRDTVYSVTLLPYFGSTTADAEGILLIPDGSGAMIRLGENTGRQYVQKVFGDDEAKTQKKQSQLTQSVLLPIYGMGTSAGGYFALIDGAAAAATVYAKTCGGIHPRNTAYADFVLCDYDETTIGESRQMSDVHLFSPKTLQEDPVVQYQLLQPSEDITASMVAVCRSLLQQRGDLPAQRVDAEWPLYLDFTGLIYKESTVLGIPYREKQVLSTISEVESVVKRLHDEGITRLVIRLIGFSSDGAVGGASCDWQPDAAVGTTEDLLRLQKAIEDKGGTLYWEAPLSEVYHEGLLDAFYPEADAARMINRKTALVKTADRVTLDYTGTALQRYLVSPASYQSRLQTFLETILTDQTVAVSWGAAGDTLYSDFNRSRPYDRCMSVWAVTETLEQLSSGRPVLTEGGHVYTWRYVSDIVDMPLRDSGYEIAAHPYPFVQSVLRGTATYAGTAVNLSSDPESQLLYTLMSGASLHYSWITRDDALLLDTAYEQERYSLSYVHWFDEAVANYQAMRIALGKTASTGIASFSEESPRVYRLRYADDTTVVVNLSSQAVVIGGCTIPAKGWQCVESSEKEVTP